MIILYRIIGILTCSESHRKTGKPAFWKLDLTLHEHFTEFPKWFFFSFRKVDLV